MSISLIVSVLLVATVLLATARLARGANGFTVRQLIAALILQSLLALLLYFTLFPPASERAAERLVLATAGTTRTQIDAQADDSIVLALPEAPRLPGVLRVPDLGTALRQHPQAQKIRVLGVGLTMRDRDVARGLAIEFDAAPLPRGVVDLWSPSQVSVGTRWGVSGRVQAVEGGTVELIDPAGRKGEVFKLKSEGKFTLHGNAPATGFATFTLRVRDAHAQLVEAIKLPLHIAPGAAPRVLVLAGGPDPELKYLRRWAQDSAVAMQTQIALGAGVAVGDAPVPIDAQTLRGFDLLVLDERAWRALGASRKAAIAEALRAGLGVMIRVTGPLSQAERREFSDLGFAIAPADLTGIVSLSASSYRAPRAGSTNTGEAVADENALQISRQPLRVKTSDAIALVKDDAGDPLAVWRSVGQGRLALWWLGSSYQLVLAGESAAHGQLWSDAFATLARPHGTRLPWLASDDPRPQQRLVLCGLADGASVEGADGKRTPLLLQATANAGSCAVYWPNISGWWWLNSGGATLPFHVRVESQAKALAARENRDATSQMLTSIQGTTRSTRVAAQGQRWPWFLGWLLASSLSWWFERRNLRSIASS